MKVSLNELKELHSQGLNDQEIGKYLGFSRNTIRSARIKLGLKLNYQRVKLVGYYKEKIIELFNQGHTVTEISNEIGFNYVTVLNFCKREGLVANDTREQKNKQAEKDLELFINYLEKNGPSSQKEIVEKLNISAKWCKKFIEVYPDIFNEYKIKHKVGIDPDLLDYYFGDLIFKKSGSIYSLINDERIFDYIANKIVDRIDDSEDDKVVYKYLKICLGRENALNILSVIKKYCGDSFTKRKIQTLTNSNLNIKIREVPKAEAVSDLPKGSLRDIAEEIKNEKKKA